MKHKIHTKINMSIGAVFVILTLLTIVLFIRVNWSSLSTPSDVPLLSKFKPAFINPDQLSDNTFPASNDSSEGETPSGCSVFTLSKGNHVFFGGNNDFSVTDSFYWVDRGGENKYGAIWIGEYDNVQQGVNEKGLAYDANGVPKMDVNAHPERQHVAGGYSSYPIYILRECATVAEVIAWVDTHQWHTYMHDQLHFADASGDAVIISVGLDGEVSFTRKPPGDGYLVSTNFNVANPTNGYTYPCWRYEKASQLLEELVSQERTLTFQDATDVLDAVHVADPSGWTLGSLVADLPNGIVYLYYFHQFDNPVILNVSDEIANPRPGMVMSRLFPENVQQEAMRRYEKLQSRGENYENIGKIWLGTVVASLITFLISTSKHRTGWPFWIPTVMILGPLALLIWLVAGRKRKAGNWQLVLVEVAGDLSPTIVAYLVSTVMLVLFPREDSLQILYFVSFPLLIGWFIFQSFLLNFASRQGYFRTLFHRMPHAWVAANLGLAGIFPITTMLASMSVQIPLPAWTVAAWWGFSVLNGLIAMFLLYIFTSWCLRHGYRAWTILAGEQGEVITGSWRKLWWWIPISYIILMASLLSYMYLEGVM